MARRFFDTIVRFELVLLAAGVVVAGITAGFWPAMVLATFLAGGVAVVALGRSIPPGVHAVVLAVALLDAAGFAWGLFHSVPPYDELAHLFTSVAVSIIVAYLFFDPSAVRFERRSLFVLAVAGTTLGIGIMWELVELVFQFAGSRRDTLSDLVLDFAGALAGAAIAGALLERERPRPAWRAATVEP